MDFELVHTKIIVRYNGVTDLQKKKYVITPHGGTLHFLSSLISPCIPFPFGKLGSFTFIMQCWAWTAYWPFKEREASADEPQCCSPKYHHKLFYEKNLCDQIEGVFSWSEMRTVNADTVWENCENNLFQKNIHILVRYFSLK